LLRPDVPPAPVNVPPATTAPATSDPKADQSRLIAAINQGGPVVTATVEQVSMTSESTVTGSNPRAVVVTMQVLLKDLVPLKGGQSMSVRFNYSALDGRDLLPKVGEKVIVVSTAPPQAPAADAPGGEIHPGRSFHPTMRPAIRPAWVMLPQIVTMAEATDSNLAAVKAAIAHPASQPEAANIQPK
jgi:hypothetical protein